MKLSPAQQQEQLIKYNIFPFKYRLFYRFCLFSRKILKGQILAKIHDKLAISHNLHDLRKSSKNILEVPFARSKRGAPRISIVLPKLVNNVLRNIYNHDLSIFKELIFVNINKYFLSFCKTFN